MSILEHGSRGRRRGPRGFGVESLDLLPGRTRATLDRAGDRFTVGPGKVLLPAGATVRWIFIVLDGELVLKDSEGESVFRAGSAYGALEALDSARTPGDLAARDVTTVLAVPVQAYRGLAETDPDFSYWILRSLAEGGNQ